MNEKMQLNFRISDKLLEQAKNYVDGIGFRSVGHILNIALAEWIAKRTITCPLCKGQGCHACEPENIFR